ncbi:MAG TPA: RtcB family protein [Pedococcus sp.]|jgi:tRNA-splicing ligase RtcB
MSATIPTTDASLRVPRVFDSAAVPANPEVLATLERGVAAVDLAARPVVLPDFHHKHDMEMPSSIAVATTGTIRPAFTSASVNCGMALLALDAARPDDTAVTAFFGAIAERYPHPPSWRRELSSDDVVRAAVEGAEFGVERYGLDPSDLERIEEGGRLDLDPYGGAARLRRELPRLSFQASRFRFGTVGPSNHFVELQTVEEVLDPTAAAALGVAEGQLTIQFHAGGGLLTGQVGRLFARRKKINRALALEMAFARTLAHLFTVRSVAQLRERLDYYFREGCPAIPLDGDEGTRAMLANLAAMNYGFAFRTATYATLAQLAVQQLGAASVRLVVDSPHNSIYPEQVGGADAVVHRHNSCRAYPAERMAPGTAFGSVGQAVLVPGMHYTSSYLCVASDGAEQSLYSACHGAGTVIDGAVAAGWSDLDEQGRSTLRFRYGQDEPERVPHVDDRGIDAALSILTRHDLVRPVARLRPMAVLN